jgi:hypothetical protein
MLDDPITVQRACVVIGGEEKPINPATFYRGVKAGRYPAPEKISPGLVRVSTRKLLAALGRDPAGEPPAKPFSPLARKRV